jgi:hypothetical protein
LESLKGCATRSPQEFQDLPDHRTGNATRYELADVLKSAFAMFSLKSP